MSIHYSRRRVLLHWLSAAIILWALASGFYVAFNPVSASTEHWVGSLNVSLTTLSLLVALHLCAVLWHELSGRRVVRRMFFAKPAGTFQRAQR